MKLKYNNSEIIKLATVVFLAILIFLSLYPVNIGIVRAALAGGYPLLWLSLTYWLWKYKKLRWIPPAIFILGIIFLLIPGRQINKQSIRSSYVKWLKYYENTRYIWGGENRFGIDCSGLVRKAFINACFWDGIKTLNPAPVRKAIELWWYDCSARSLRDGYRDFAVKIFKAKSINKLDSSKLQTGDFAVTTNGVHALAYMGNNVWIEADPGIYKVIVVDVPTTGNAWFDTPVYILRWQEL